MKYTFFAHCHAFASAAGLFSRSRGRGTQGPRVYTPEQDWSPARFRGACNGRSKSRGAGSFRGIAFRRARAEQVHGNPKLSFCHFTYAVSEVPQQSPKARSRCTTATVQAFPLVTATDGACACVCVERAC